jgi:hypothetical protein
MLVEYPTNSTLSDDKSICRFIEGGEECHIIPWYGASLGGPKTLKHNILIVFQCLILQIFKVIIG